MTDSGAPPDLGSGLIDQINRHLGGFNEALGLHFVSATPGEVIAELEVDEHHLQPYGIVHGGVLASMVETICSVGAAISVLDAGSSTVGLENSTSFLRAVRSGCLRGTARPERLGRRTQVWTAIITDDEGRKVATGRLRLLVLEQGARAAGEEVRLRED